MTVTGAHSARRAARGFSSVRCDQYLHPGTLTGYRPLAADGGSAVDAAHLKARARAQFDAQAAYGVAGVAPGRSDRTRR